MLAFPGSGHFFICICVSNFSPPPLNERAHILPQGIKMKYRNVTFAHSPPQLLGLCHCCCCSLAATMISCRVAAKMAWLLPGHCISHLLGFTKNPIYGILGEVVLMLRALRGKKPSFLAIGMVWKRSCYLPCNPQWWSKRGEEKGKQGKTRQDNSIISLPFCGSYTGYPVFCANAKCWF